MKEKLLKAGYRTYNKHSDEPTLYQKKITDKIGIKYFINCYHYNFPDHDTWEFKIQLDSDIGTYNITLFNTGDISIMNIETVMECEWNNHEAKYYEKYL